MTRIFLWRISDFKHLNNVTFNVIRSKTQFQVWKQGSYCPIGFWFKFLCFWTRRFSERDFSVSSKNYDSNPRLRKLFWKRATNIFRNYNNFKWEEWYELWLFIKPYDESKSGFVRVMSTYNECKVIVGEVYSEQQFEKYITSL